MDDFRDETIETYKEWLRHTGRRRHMHNLIAFIMSSNILPALVHSIK